MTAIETMLREPVIQAIGWALVHFFWQGTLIALIAAAALRALRHSAADVRYVVAAITLCVMATLPVVTGVQVYRAAASQREAHLSPPRQSAETSHERGQGRVGEPTVVAAGAHLRVGAERCPADRLTGTVRGGGVGHAVAGDGLGDRLGLSQFDVGGDEVVEPR